MHAPDWRSSERVDYTLRLFEILAKLLPQGMDGGISTSPLSYRFWFSDNNELQKAMLMATENIIRTAENLIKIRKETGIKLHLDIEPEPDGILESGAEFIDWYENVLLPLAKETLPKLLHITEEETEKLIKEHICLCYDVCHFAIGYESHGEVLKQLSERGIRVGKIQISAALKADLPSEIQSTQSDILDVLKVQQEQPFTTHMEVETYTWEVLPESLKLPIDQSIIRELNWVSEIMR